MARFPEDLPQAPGTDFEPNDQTIVQQSPGGERNTINPHQSREDVGWMNVVLKPLAYPADTSTLEAHVAAHQKESFEFVLQSRPDIVWTCLHLGRPTYRDVSQDGSVQEARLRLAVKGNDEFV